MRFYIKNWRPTLNGAQYLRRENTNDIKGIEHIDKVIDINQSPIGRTPTFQSGYLYGVFNDIRELYCFDAGCKNARLFNAGRFSFNVKGGRCEACQGDGIIKD